MYRVDFITTEHGDDLIVSFAVTSDLPGGILSLTLLRTPKYEFILDPDERGVSVSWEKDEDDSELLRGVDLSGDKVKLSTTRREFILDVSRIDDRELRRMRKVLQKMNFDNRIRLAGPSK